MTYKKITASIVSFLISLMAFSGLAVVPAFAATTSTNVTANTATREQKIITRSDTEIAKRITTLNNISERISGMKNLSDAEKTSINNEINANITGLTALKAKIDGETDLTTLLADEKSIITTFRIYVLIVPQGYIAAASDRITTVSSMLSTVASKLQTRITEAQSAGKNVATLVTTLADLNAKLADANTQAAKAQSRVVSLVPDQGNTTVAASNHAALVAARADIKVATADLKAARQDAGTIIKAIIAFHIENTPATTTPTITQ